ncbi:hypothetical protein MKW92_040790 [Papaver armeniacum]|nr:hypothetical protein MKW92_040790 [Papaver armeniacum]
MGSGRLPKKGRDDGNLSKNDKYMDIEGRPIYFESKSAGPAEDSFFVYPSKYRGRTSDTSTYTSLGSLSDLWSVLSEEEIALFKTTAIGHLTDIPRDQRWSKTIFCFMMSRQIKFEPGEYLNDEILFRVKDTNLCFGKAEFSLISGLRFRDLRDGHSDFDSPPKMSRLKHKYFSGDNRITGGHLYDFIF